MKEILLLVIFVLVKNIGFSQDFDTNKLDAYFSQLTSNNKFMGSIAVYKDNSICYHKQFGFSEVLNRVIPNKETKYRIGSISKTFTAVLVFKAIEENKLSLTETIDSFFPEIKNATKITIADLLQHRSGIHSFTDDMDKYLSYHTQAKSEKEMVKIIAAYDNDFEPNTQAAYSNSNYLLLSYILEEIYDKTFAQILEEKLCEPLGLESTYFSKNLAIEQNEAYSYQFDKEWKVLPQTDGTIGLGAGSLVSTTSDLIQFSKALFDGQLILDEHLEHMTTIKDRFGMGLFQSTYYGLVSYGHNGGIDNFVSMFRYFPKEKIGFAVTANGLDYDFNLIETVIVKSLLNKYYDVPIFAIYKPQSKELNQYIGMYSSDTYPVTIHVIKQKKQLILRVANNAPMPLEAFAKGKFKFDKAGIVVEFIPSKNEMQIKQSGKTSSLKRE